MIINAKTAVNKTRKALFKDINSDPNTNIIKNEINKAIKNFETSCNANIKTDNIYKYIKYLHYLGYIVRNVQLPDQMNNLYISW